MSNNNVPIFPYTIKSSEKIDAIELAYLILRDAKDYNGVIMIGDALTYILCVKNGKEQNVITK